MKLFGTSQQASFQKNATNSAALRSTLQEPVGDDNRSDRELDASLKFVLEGEKAELADKLSVRPAKEQAMPELVYKRHDLQRNETDDPADDEPEEINSAMPGWLKGTLLMLSSAILFVLVLFGVYMNLV